MYAKVFSQIYDGTLCTKGPWQALVTFQQLLVLADQDGCVDMTIPAISRRTTIPQDIIECGIAALLLPDPESRTPTLEGKRIIPLSEGRLWGWKVVNYAHYRQLKREDDRRAYHREYWHKRKADKQLLNPSTSTQHTQPSQPIAYAEAYTEEENTRATRSVATLPIPDDLLKEFKAVRKKKRLGAITQRVADSLQREARAAGLTLEQAITKCCERGWGGFEAAWVKSPADIAKATVPGSTEADPALAKLDADQKICHPPPPEIRQRLQSLKGKS